MVLRFHTIASASLLLTHTHTHRLYHDEDLFIELANII